MNTPLPVTARSSHHPMMIIAAVAVVLFCLAGTAAIMGWIPSSIGGNPANRELTEADRQALTAQMETRPQDAPPLAQQYAPQAQGQYAPPAQHAPSAAPQQAPVQLAAAAPAKNWCSNCGNVESIRTITQRAQGSGVGAAGGAILGGLLGNQVGSGHGRQLATVAGAVGGAVVGNQVEGNMKATHSYEIRVRLDDGKYRTFHQQSAPAWQEGQRVRVVNGSIHSVN